MGDPNKIFLGAGQLIHREISYATDSYTWNMPETIVTLADPAKVYFIYAKCSSTSNSATWHVSDEMLRYDQLSGYYYFRIGVVFEVVDGVRSEALDYGKTWINGRFVTTGRIQSALGEAGSYFDLDTGYLKVGAGSTGLESFTEWAAKQAELDALNTYIDVTLPSELEAIQNQIDGVVISFFDAYVPTTSNEPASLWITDLEKDNHLNDTFTNTATGASYRWVKIGSVYSWSEIIDSASTAALAAAARAQDTADGKRRVFIVTPTTPYDAGDLWVDSSTGDLKKCITQRLTGSYASVDWAIATKYTDDTAANLAAIAAALAKTTADTANSSIADMASDDKITPLEKTSLKLEWDTIQSEKTKNDLQATLFGVSSTAYGVAYTALETYIGSNLVDLTTTWSLGTGGGITMRTTFKAYYDARTDLLNAISTNAKNRADAANSLIADIASDDKITPSEKHALKLEWDIIVAEKPKYDIQAVLFSVSSTAYGAAYSALATYIGSNLDILTTTWDLGSGGGITMRSTFKAYYDARTDIANAISAKAKAIADGKVTIGGSAADINANTVTINGGKITANTITTLGSIESFNGLFLKDDTATGGTDKYVFGATYGANSAYPTLYLGRRRTTVPAATTDAGFIVKRDTDGKYKMHIGNNLTYINWDGDALTVAGAILANTKTETGADFFSIVNGTILFKMPIASTGDITAYTSLGSTGTIFDELVSHVDNTTIVYQDGKLTAIGGTGGGGTVLNGTGLVRMSGTTVSYDATQYISSKLQIESLLTGTITSHGHNYEPVISAGVSTQYYRGDKTWATLNTSIVPESTNLYYTEARVTANTNVAANTAARHSAVTLGTSNGLSLVGQALSLQVATSLLTGALSSTDWATFNGKQAAIASGTTAQYYRGDKSWATLNTAAVPESTNLYYTEARVTANTSVAASAAARHNAVTLGTANGLSLSTQVLSLQIATSSLTGALSSADWNTFNGKQAALGFTPYNSTNPSGYISGITKAMIEAQLTGSITSHSHSYEPVITASTTAKYYRGDKSWQDLNKTAVGLANVDNTTDANKPISSATQTALNLKANIASPTFTGTVSGITTLMVSESTNLYYTEARVTANANVAANTAARHSAVTLGTSNGLSLAGQEVSLRLATSAFNGALSSADWTTFNNKQAALTNPVTGAGTLGFMPKYTGATSVSDSPIYTDGVNIGVCSAPVAQAIAGAGTVVVSGSTVTGTGTSFLSTFKAGDTITVTTTSGVETKQIVSITSATVLTTIAFAGTASGVSYLVNQLFTSLSSKFQIYQPSVGHGVITVVSTAIAGIGTQFSSTFRVGDLIYVATSIGLESRTIASISSDTAMAVTVAFTGSATGVSYSLIGGERFSVKGNGNVAIFGALSARRSFELKDAAGVTKWTISMDASSNLQFANASGVVEARLDQNGDMFAKGNLTAYSSLI